MTLSDTQKKQAIFWLEYSQQLSNAIRYHEALKAAQKAVSLDETNAEAWYALGTCKAMLAHYREALDDFDHALQLDDHYVSAWDGKAWVLGILNQKEAALQAIDQALQLDPDYMEARRRKQRLLAL